MPYHVVAFTMAQVRTGALDFQRHLSAIVQGQKDIKVYQVSPFDLDERKRFRDRFGGDIVYFLNDAARAACDLDGVEMQYLADIPESELPKRKTLVIGIPG
jgi:peroxiredoxin